MPKDYIKSNNNLKEYFEYYISQMEIDERFRPLLVDIMLRRSIEFDFTPEEIQQDMHSLMVNLETVKIGKMPKSLKNAAGCYEYDSKRIIISEEYVRNAKTTEDFENIYEIFTHEVFHALARDEYGESKISTPNCYTKEHFFSLEEAIVEKAADRCVYSRQWDEKNSPFFHQNKFGYSDITYITDIIEATYGVTEKAFLRNAIQGRRKVAKFLSMTSGEPLEDTLAFLDGIEINYSRLHKALYESNLKGHALETEVKETMASSLLLCAWKLNSNISRINTSPNKLNDAALKLERYKYGHNKMLLVTNAATHYFDKRFKTNRISNYVYNLLDPTRDNNSYRVNALSQIFEKRKEIPPDDLDRLLYIAKNGYKGKKENKLFAQYGISQDSPKYVPLNDDYIYLRYRKTDFENIQWDNSSIEYESRTLQSQFDLEQKSFFLRTKNNVKEKLKYIKRTFKEALDDYLDVFRPNQGLLPSGDNTLGVEESENISTERHDQFGSLSQEELENFNQGMTQVLNKNAQKLPKDRTSKEDREDIDY